MYQYCRAFFHLIGNMMRCVSLSGAIPSSSRVWCVMHILLVIGPQVWYVVRNFEWGVILLNLQFTDVLHLRGYTQMSSISRGTDVHYLGVHTDVLHLRVSEAPVSLHWVIKCPYISCHPNATPYHILCPWGPYLYLHMLVFFVFTVLKCLALTAQNGFLV